jgi:hypothetical protein
MSRTFLLLALAACLLWPGAARAQTPPEARMAIAREIVELSGGTDTMLAMMDTMAPAMQADMRSRGVPEEFAARFTRLFIEEFRAELPRIVELTAIAYAGAFSEAELADMRDFWGSSSGQALRQRSPELTRAMTQAGMLIGAEASARVAARIEAENARPHDTP